MAELGCEHRSGDQEIASLEHGKQSKSLPIEEGCMDEANACIQHDYLSHDEDDEWPVRMSAEVASSIFRPQKDHTSNQVHPSLSSDGSFVLGKNLMENLMDAYSCKNQEGGITNNLSEDEFEPIPLKFWQAQGASVQIDFPYEVTHTEAQPSHHFVGAIASGSSLAEQDSSKQSCVFGEHEIMDAAALRNYETQSAASQYISPDPTAKTSGSGFKRTISSTSTMQDPIQPKKKPRIRSDVAGAQAPQMAPLDRFLEYLKEDESTIDAYKSVETIVEDCQKKHEKGVHRYRNLPGAVFERAVDVLGAVEFQRLFKASQQKLKNSPHPKRTRVEEVGKASIPNLIETAVGYGFHLARIHFLHDSSNASNVHDILMQGVNTVNRMSEVERAQFWKYMVDSSVHQRPKANMVNNLRVDES